MEAAREDSPSVADEEAAEDAERDEHPRSFDPGLTTGYLRRGSRDHDLPVEIGAAPFDPGPGTGYDERRAKREEKRRLREEEQRRKRQAQVEHERELREHAERDARAQEEHERLAKIEGERLERERAERAARERAEREERKRRLAALRERERLERRREEIREQQRRERQATLQRERMEHARIERERAARARADREKLQRERARRQAQLEREREHLRRKELARQKAKRKGTAAPHRKAAVAAVSKRRPPPSRSRSHQRRPQGLGWPTARAAVALAAVTAVAGVLGAAVGLPVPVLGGPGGPIAASLTGNSLLDSGTPPGLTKGPYFPVVTDNPDFGEADAGFGANRSGHIHQGQDVFVKPGTPLVAVRDGIVIDGAGGKSFYAYGGGNSLVIYSAMDDRSYVYMHMLHPALVHTGETVQAGQPVGQVGCTGSCDGPHLHFEIRRGRVGYGVERKAIDPLPYLQEWPAAPTE